MPRLFLALILWLPLAFHQTAAAQAVLPPGVPPMEFGRDTLAITTDKGRFVYDLEVATTPDQQARGLMFRPVLGTNKGMLFIFDQQRQLSFWMRNTLIPLDMVFIDNDGKLVSIQREAEPKTTTPRPSSGPARYVLEIDGGEAAILGIDENTVFEFGDPTKAYVAAVDKALGN